MGVLALLPQLNIGPQLLPEAWMMHPACTTQLEAPTWL